MLPLEDYPGLAGFGAANDAYVPHAVDLGASAITGALDDAGLASHDVDAVFFTTVTGVAAPSIEARIANRRRGTGGRRTSRVARRCGRAALASAACIWPGRASGFA